MSPIISCEHASNRVPEQMEALFRGHEEVLDSHRGYDLGAAPLARFLAERLKAPLLLSQVSRLVVDCNRSLTHPRLFSKFSRMLPPLTKEEIVAEWYLPYRNTVYREVEKMVSRTGHCLHIAVHSFTPYLKDKERKAHIGLLYDPSRNGERRFCSAMAHALRQKLPDYQVRCNYPYKGVSDGLVPAMRKSFSQERYIGVELELNQALYSQDDAWPLDLGRQLGILLSQTAVD